MAAESRVRHHSSALGPAESRTLKCASLPPPTGQRLRHATHRHPQHAGPRPLRHQVRRQADARQVWAGRQDGADLVQDDHRAAIHHHFGDAVSLGGGGLGTSTPILPSCCLPSLRLFWSPHIHKTAFGPPGTHQEAGLQELLHPGHRHPPVRLTRWRRRPPLFPLLALRTAESQGHPSPPTPHPLPPPFSPPPPPQQRAQHPQRGKAQQPRRVARCVSGGCFDYLP